MKIDCTYCGTEFDAIKARAKCPGCKAVITVDVDEEALDVVDLVEDDESPSRPRQAPLNRSRIVCPMCAEDNRPTAKVCRYCGESLRLENLSGVWRDGHQLVMSQDAELPYRCIKTNEPAETLLRRKLSWHSPVIFVAILGGLLIYVILAIVLSKKADIQVPLARRIQKRRITAIIMGWLLGLGGLGAMILSCLFLAESQNPAWKDAIPFVIFGGIVFVIFSALISSVIASIVAPAKITDDYVWLKGVHPDYLAALPEWPGE